MYMASKKTKEKIGFKDLVTFAKAGWTPEETNALLDRLDAMGDPNDINDDNVDDDIEDEIDDDLDNDPDDDDVDPDDDDNVDDVEDRKDSDNESKDSNDVRKNLDRLKQVGLEVENERLKKELAKLKAKNRNKDVSGDTKKSAQDSFTDALQSCF